MIYVDANIIYNAIVKTELTEYARNTMRLSGKVTSWTAINETVYAIFRKLAEREGYKTVHAIKDMPQTERQKLLDDAFETVERCISENNITQIRETQDTYISHQIAAEYGLLPSDATILATVLSHGITKIATLDRDFEVVKDIIELLPREYWEE